MSRMERQPTNDQDETEIDMSSVEGHPASGQGQSASDQREEEQPASGQRQPASGQDDMMEPSNMTGKTITAEQSQREFEKATKMETGLIC